jgi:hypothetical protein
MSVRRAAHRLAVAIAALVSAACGEFPALPPAVLDAAAPTDPDRGADGSTRPADAAIVDGPPATDAAPGDAQGTPDGHAPDGAPAVPDAAGPAQDAVRPPPDVEVTSDVGGPPAPDAHVPPAPDAHVPPAPDAAVMPVPDAAAMPDAALPDAAVPDAGPACEPVTEVCNDVDDDCDGAVDEDFDHKGAPCIVDAPGRCGAGVFGCIVGADAPVCVGGGEAAAETCNGLDDDCDGEIDEIFDLESDAQHCGACGRRCDPLPHGRGLCALGECFLARCDATWHDEDTRIENGCELEEPGRVLYVRGNGDDANAGTNLAPLATLAEAVARANAAPDVDRVAVIDVGEGRFAAGLNVHADFLTVRGASRDRTRLLGGLRITGDYTRVQDLTVDGEGVGRGIHLTCGEGCAVVSTVVENVGPAPDPEARAGSAIAAIRITAGDDHLVHGNVLRRIHGSTPPVVPFGAEQGCRWGHGSQAAGILVEAGAAGSRLQSNVISEVEGGAGNAQERFSCDAGGLGGLGGPAYGIYLADRAGNCLLVDNRIDTVVGGAGGAGQAGLPLDPEPPDAGTQQILRAPDGNGGGGGLAAGIRIESAGHRLRGNVLSGITGGAGAPAGGPMGEPGPDAVGVGVYFHPFGGGVELPPDFFEVLTENEPALDVDLDESNVYEGEAIHYCFGRRVDWSNRRFTGALTPTNLGRLVLVDCDGSTVRNNVVEGFVGATGQPLTEGHRPTSGGQAAAILLIGTSGAEIAGNLIEGVIGGHGAQGAFDVETISLLSAGGDGGAAAGIRLMRSDANVLTDNDITDIRGGRGGPGGLGGGNGGNGGRAAALELTADSDGNLLARNVLRDVLGGEGGPQRFFIESAPAGAPEGTAVGVRIGDEASRAASIDETNTYEGWPFTYFHRSPGASVSARHYSTCKAMTNLGQFVVLDSPGATLTDVAVTCEPAPGERVELVGEPGAASYMRQNGRAGGAYAAVRIERSDAVSVDGLRIDNVAGGPGGHTHIGTRGGDGGLGLGVFIADSDGVTVSNAHLSRVRAGKVADARPGVPGIESRGFAGLAGEAVGVYLTRSRGFALRHLLVHDVTSEIWAFGVVADAVGQDNVIAQATIVNIRGDNRTAEDQPPQTNVTAAVLLQGAAPGQLRLENAVVADVSGIPVIVGGGLSMTRTAVCFRGDRQVFAFGPLSVDGPFWENPEPLFLEGAEPPYGLDPRSMCVDLGTGPCVDEPAPEGFDCLPDVGYEGNSPRGQVRQP